MNGLKTHQTGFNLLEALLAVVILSIGLLGLAGMQMANLKSVHNSTQKQQATILLHDLVARIRNNYPGAKQGLYKTDDVSCVSAPTNMCRDISCSPTELAKMDLYQVACGDGRVGGIKTALTNGRLAITCDANDCTKAVNVVISWDERVTLKNKSQETVQGSTTTGDDSEFKRFDLSSQIVVRNI